MLLKDKIKQLRKDRGLTQASLGKLINKSSQVISNWERGYTSSINQDDIKRLANALNINISELLDDTDFNINNAINAQVENKPKDLIKLLEKEEYTLNGVLVTPEDKEKLKRIIEAAFGTQKKKINVRSDFYVKSKIACQKSSKKIWHIRPILYC